MDFSRRPGSGTPALTPAEFERAKTWLAVIAEALLVEPEWRLEGDERKYRGTGGLSISMAGGGWYDHAARVGGRSAIKLVMHLKKCNYPQAVQWLVPFLAASPGTGPCSAGGGDTDDTGPASADDSREILDQVKDVAGTPSEIYLKSRGLPGPYPDGLLGHLDNARVGESALVAVLTEHERVTGVQLGYLTPAGGKSLVKPARSRFNLEKSPGGVFRIPAPDPAAALDPAADYLVCEGVEDALSLAQLKRNLTILGLPGIGALQHLDLPKGAKVTVVRDGDEPDSGPDKALTAGVDALLLAGAMVRVTETPLGFDANRILQEKDLDALRRLAARPPQATLSYRGRVIGLSRIDPDDRVKFAAERKAIAKVFGVSVAAIDKDVEKLRPTPTAAASAPSSDDRRAGKVFEFTDTVPHPEPIDGAVLVVELVETIGRYVIMSRHQRIGVALWIVFTHLFEIADVAAKLLITSPLSECGKTRLMRVVRYLSPRPLIVSNATASSVFRVIEAHCPTLLLDEADTFIANNEELRGILDSGFDRDDAAVLRNVSGPDGTIEPRIFSTWCPQAIAGIGRLPPTITRRCFVIEMQRKSKGQTVAKLTRRTAGPLLDLARKVARWAVDHRDAVAGTVPQIPAGMSDRLDEGWEVPLAIAEVIGGEWPEQARQAALAISAGQSGGEDDGIGTQLLADIHDAFAAELDETPDREPRLASDALVTFLTNLEERPWGEIGRGDRPLTKNKLASLLRPFRIRPGTVQISSGESAHDAKGYYLRQFRDAFERYLSSDPPDSTVQTVGASEAAETLGESADSQNVGAVASDVLKTAQNPSVSAASDVPTVEKSQNARSAKEEVSVPGSIASRKTSKSTSLAPPEPADLGDLGGPSVGAHVDNSDSPTNAAAPPNGSTPTDKPRRSIPIVEEAIRATAKAHPDWSLAQIGKECGRAESVVRRILGITSA